MKMKTIIVLAFAVGCGLIAMMGVQQMISKQSTEKDVPVKVLVAAENIPPGVLLNETNCEFKEFPSNAVPADAVRFKEDYAERGLKVPVDKGDIIRMIKLGTKGEIAASASIPIGMRTFSFKVDDTKTHSGLLQPGDRIDLLVTFEYISINKMRVKRTDTLLEYVEIFAVDEFRNLEAGESREIKAKNITLLVTPDQANILQLASKSELTPIMRNKNDKQKANAKGVDQDLLALLTTGIEQPDSQFGKETTAEKETNNNSVADNLKKLLNNGFAKQPAPVQEVTALQTTWRVDIDNGEEVISHDFIMEDEPSEAGNTTLQFPGQVPAPRTRSRLSKITTRSLTGKVKPTPEANEKQVEIEDEVTEEYLEEQELESTDIEGEFETEDDFKEEKEFELSLES